MDLIFWIIVLIVMAGIELATVQLVAIWFATSALVAFFVALGGADFWLQCVVFVGITAILLLLTRPLVKKLTVRRAIPTNADRNIGATGVVIETVDPSAATGRVMLDGLDWAARSSDNSMIESGAQVIVERIEGVKLIVRRADTAGTV